MLNKDTPSKIKRFRGLRGTACHSQATNSKTDELAGGFQGDLKHKSSVISVVLKEETEVIARAEDNESI